MKFLVRKQVKSDQQSALFAGRSTILQLLRVHIASAEYKFKYVNQSQYLKDTSSKTKVCCSKRANRNNPSSKKGQGVVKEQCSSCYKGDEVGDDWIV